VEKPGKWNGAKRKASFLREEEKLKKRGGRRVTSCDLKMKSVDGVKYYTEISQPKREGKEDVEKGARNKRVLTVNTC